MLGHEQHTAEGGEGAVGTTVTTVVSGREFGAACMTRR
jgi:hypothetical protein